MHSGKFLRYKFGVQTVWDRLERDGWLLLQWSGIWYVQMYLPAVVNIIGSWWGLTDEEGHNWNNGIFLLNEYMGEWGLNHYYDLYSEEGWWAMFGDFVWMSSIIGPILEPWWILILVAMGDLSFGEVNTDGMTDEEITELETKAM